jgi:AcrR family transcriptional regulator
MTLGVRKRSREILRAELAEAAADYCVEHGFDTVTVEEIAQGIGISRATYFRYFSSKEDAIFTAATTAKETLLQHLHAHPPTKGTPALDAVRQALNPAVEMTRSREKQSRARVQMIISSPYLRSRLTVERAAQGEALSTTLQQLIDNPVQARAVAALATAAIELGWSFWTEDDALDPGVAFDRAFALLVEVPTIRIDT